MTPFQAMTRALGLATGLSLAALSPASAQESWFPMKIFDSSSGTPTPAEYTPVGKAEKPYNLCVLFPHMKDSFWVAVAYGVVKQAEAANVNMTLYEAGGYENLPRQLSQFDDCLASGADAIIVGAISGAGLAQKFDEAKAKGVPVVGVVNPVPIEKLPAANFVDFAAMGGVTAKGLLASLGSGETANVVTFPGPRGLGLGGKLQRGLQEGGRRQRQRQDPRREVRRLGRRRPASADPGRAPDLSRHERHLGHRADGGGRDRRGGRGRPHRHEDHLVLREPGDARRAEPRRHPRLRHAVSRRRGRDRHRPGDPPHREEAGDQARPAGGGRHRQDHGAERQDGPRPRPRRLDPVYSVKAK